jgi:ABC-type iron transport system FetAB permease component
MLFFNTYISYFHREFFFHVSILLIVLRYINIEILDVFVSHAFMFIDSLPILSHEKNMKIIKNILEFPNKYLQLIYHDYILQYITTANECRILLISIGFIFSSIHH